MYRRRSYVDLEKESEGLKFDDGDEGMSFESLMKLVKEKEKLLSLLEIDNTALKARCKILEDKSTALEDQTIQQAKTISSMEDNVRDAQMDSAVIKEQLAEAKLHIVKLQNIIDLRRAADVARVSSWEVFRELYTTPSECTNLTFEEKKLGEEGASLVADTLDAFSTLASLSLARNQIGPQGMELLSVPLCTCSTLTELQLHNNALNDEAMSAVSAIIHSTRVSLVNLANNKIACEGAAVLGSAIAKGVHITTLNLGENRIAVRGAQALSQALLQNTSLRLLSLASNQLGDYGCTHIAGMLRINRSLRDLNLSSNDIRELGVGELSSSVVDNEVLTTLRLVDNEKLGQEGHKALTALQQAATSKRLRIYF